MNENERKLIKLNLNEIVDLTNNHISIVLI